MSFTPPNIKPEDEPRFHCTDCFDEVSGFRYFYCRGSGEEWRETPPHIYRNLPVNNCGRPNAHYGHPYVEKCHCWQKNPAVAELKRKLTGTKR
jgi:hypothetical protein